MGRTWLQTHCQALREAVPGRVRACASPGVSLPASEVSVCLRERDAHPGRATHGTGRQPHRCTARSEAPAADVAHSRSLARGSEAAWPPPGRRLGPGGGRARLSLGLDLGCLFRAVEKACQQLDAKTHPRSPMPRRGPLLRTRGHPERPPVTPASASASPAPHGSRFPEAQAQLLPHSPLRRLKRRPAATRDHEHVKCGPCHMLRWHFEYVGITAFKITFPVSFYFLNCG